MTKPLLFSSLILTLIACGDSGDGNGVDPTDVRFGDTALIVVVNPAINDANRHSLPMAGDVRSGVLVQTDDGVSATTGADGIAVLAPLTPGMRTVDVSGGGLDGTFTVPLSANALREVAIAATGTSAVVIVDLDYKSDRVVELVPTMTSGEINEALKPSDRVVFMKGGLYIGDLDFSGSRVTLFGEGALGGTVTLQGNVTMSGSDSRIRGTQIMGSLTMRASGSGLSFSRVDGTLEAIGSDGTLLANSLCGNETITGSGTIVVGNAGSAPSPACP